VDACNDERVDKGHLRGLKHAVLDVGDGGSAKGRKIAGLLEELSSMNLAGNGLVGSWEGRIVDLVRSMYALEQR
jgi:hypothetical protein